MSLICKISRTDSLLAVFTASVKEISHPLSQGFLTLEFRNMRRRNGRADPVWVSGKGSGQSQTTYAYVYLGNIRFLPIMRKVTFIRLSRDCPAHNMCCYFVFPLAIRASNASHVSRP